MTMKLTKTHLSQGPSDKSIFIGVLSFMVLITFFWLDALSIYPVTESLKANGELIFKEHQYWKAFTTSLIHADFTHLGHNAIFFTGLSVLLSNYFGAIAFPVISFFIGGIINLIALRFYPPQVYLVGISGVIYFMASFWLTMFVCIERRYSILKRLINVVGLALIFFFPEVLEQKVSYLAHGLGFAFGIPTALIYFHFNKTKIRSKEVWVEVHDPESWEEETEDKDCLSDSSYVKCTSDNESTPTN